MAEKKPLPPKFVIDGLPVKGVLKYPRLNEPDTKFKPTGEYSTKVRLDAATAKKAIAALTPLHKAAFEKEKQALEAKLADAKGEAKGKLKKALEKLTPGELPIKPAFDDEGNETGEYEISYKMNAVRKDKKNPEKLVPMSPKFFDASGNPLKKAPSIWGGTVARVSGFVSSYYAAAANTAGASLKLSAVQIIELVSGGSNKASDYGFGKEEGYEGDAAPADDAPKSDSTDGGDEDPEF